MTKPTPAEEMILDQVAETLMDENQFPGFDWLFNQTIKVRAFIKCGDDADEITRKLRYNAQYKLGLISDSPKKHAVSITYF